MQLTVFTDYGLRTLMFLAARTGEMCSVKDIANHYGISRNHLVKVVHHLSQAGYIVSAKGRGGGIRLAEGTAELCLGDIVLALEPNMNLVECFDRKTNTCKITGACQLKHYLHDANRAFVAALNEHTLADTVKNKALFG